MKKVILSTILILALVFTLAACNSDDWYGEYPEGFTPEAGSTNHFEITYRTPEELVEWSDLILTGTVIDAQFEWIYTGRLASDGVSKAYDPMIVYTIAVNDVLQTDIEVAETIEVRMSSNYRDVVRNSLVPEKLNVGEKYLFALMTFEDMVHQDPWLNDRSILPIVINSEQSVYSLQTDLPAATIAATTGGEFRTIEPDLSDDTAFRASEILALFE